jgi:2,3,4,5-tetrahydropyridine-2-carboxylate N-succinyltransferase
MTHFSGQDELRQVIETAWAQRDELSPRHVPVEVTEAVEVCLRALEHGHLRVAEPRPGRGWQVNAWLKEAILLSFRIRASRVTAGGHMHYFDKVPVRWSEPGGGDIASTGARVVPGATVRSGAYVAPDVVLMPSYVNIGAWIGEGTMVDTWATVGSCAQVGAHVHLSGGVGIGGVLEPLQAAPTIIEDDCFIGARSEIVEGVIVERGSVVSMGVYIGQSTRIYDRASGEIHYGRVPAGSVVVPGTLPAEDGSHSLYAAIIVKRVDEKTRAKTSINDILRGAQ